MKSSPISISSGSAPSSPKKNSTKVPETIIISDDEFSSSAASEDDGDHNDEEQQEETQEDLEDKRRREVQQRLLAKTARILAREEAKELAEMEKLKAEAEKEAQQNASPPKTPQRTNAGPSQGLTPPDSQLKPKGPLIENWRFFSEEGKSEAAPVRKLGNFRISRLIRNADKAGQERRSEIDLRDSNFTVDYGDYLLRLDNDALALQGWFRNMAGQEGIVPIRMTQRVFMPWALPSRIPEVENGAGLPIVFTTRVARNAAEGWNVVRNEALYDGGAYTEEIEEKDLAGLEAELIEDEGFKHEVMDVDRRTMDIRQGSLVRRYQYPWNLRVPAKELDDTVREATVHANEDADDEDNAMVNALLEEYETASNSSALQSQVIPARPAANKTVAKTTAPKNSTQKKSALKKTAALSESPDELFGLDGAGSPILGPRKTALKVTFQKKPTLNVLAAKRTASKPALPKPSIISCGTSCRDNVSCLKSNDDSDKRITRGMSKRKAENREKCGG
ncbi:hypothetical protein N431DRAFT_486718, partial [Stipitochalara longipes BDJ]